MDFNKVSLVDEIVSVSLNHWMNHIFLGILELEKECKIPISASGKPLEMLIANLKMQKSKYVFRHIRGTDSFLAEVSINHYVEEDLKKFKGDLKDFPMQEIATLNFSIFPSFAESEVEVRINGNLFPKVQPFAIKFEVPQYNGTLNAIVSYATGMTLGIAITSIINFMMSLNSVRLITNGE